MILSKKFSNEIFYYENVFDNPKLIIDTLNKIDNNEKSHQFITKWYKWLASNNEEDCFGEKKDMFYSNMINNKKEASSDVVFVLETMKNNIDTLCYQFIKDRELNINPNISPFLDMCKYTKGGSLGLHYDGQDGDRSLMYSIVMYFNDDYEGGELSFHIADEKRNRPGDSIDNENIDFWIKPKPGSAMIFPSTYPYLHQSHPIKSGCKYMSTSFIFVDGYDPFNPDHVREYRNI